MSGCPYYNDPCNKNNCPHKVDSKPPCGLFNFLKHINRELADFPNEKKLITKLKEEYVETWKKEKESHAPGRATGTTFEKWIKKQIGVHDENRKTTGTVNFTFGKFAVDLALPSRETPRVILEIKLGIDTQHALALGGLLDYKPEHTEKLGLVTLYKRAEEPPVGKILRDLKENKHKDRFDYFIIEGENGWSNAIQRLKKFCTL